MCIAESEIPYSDPTSCLREYFAHTASNIVLKVSRSSRVRRVLAEPVTTGGAHTEVQTAVLNAIGGAQASNLEPNTESVDEEGSLLVAEWLPCLELPSSGP